ncbi:hypothetical protein F0Q45_07515 [Mycobacterium simiae]|uniref:Uncharacterized protein n=1 Tax=Mycobacterium simiae TaxID=1784 RepID=A0A5B1BTZ3_MYCSI|nr:hypothetical protein [Mycobacterium simiae]KAA1250813.1 hypothetical protein F0Q45_07515 [Mycobacterium simiae]
MAANTRADASMLSANYASMSDSASAHTVMSRSLGPRRAKGIAELGYRRLGGIPDSSSITVDRFVSDLADHGCSDIGAELVSTRPANW